jgi:hypothetical protein
MKTLKLITAGALSAFAISAASASTEIRFTGSTAFRNATVNAIQNYLKSDYVWGYQGTKGAGANQQIFIGETNATPSVNVIIKTAWAGSAGGVVVLAENINAVVPFIADSTLTGVTFSPAGGSVSGTALTHAGVQNLDAAATENHTADIALSDAYPASTPFTGTGFTTLNDQVVGIVPFEWVGGYYTTDGGTTTTKTLYPGVANLTIPQIQELLGGGIALGQITGNVNDNSIAAITIGRDHDSGTRIGAFYNAQIGGLVLSGTPSSTFEDQAGIEQFEANGQIVGATQTATQNAGSGVINTLVAWPAENVVNENRAAGEEGFFTGGNVAATLERPADINPADDTTPLGLGIYDIAYLGMSDAAGVDPASTAVTGTDGAGNTWSLKPSLNGIKFNGVAPGGSAAPFAPPYTNILNGSYTFWGYEHYLYPVAATTGTLKTVADGIAAQLTSEADNSGVGILLSDPNLHATRGDGPVNDSNPHTGDGFPVTTQ